MKRDQLYYYVHVTMTKKLEGFLLEILFLCIWEKIEDYDTTL